ncbi:hypothetical protein DY000_02058451 [Brassica cretica]|uniref:Uncharacterized protein n=1 Tax=Brassica cretica TaxID=69181 RepID=A0ABQ7B1A1_BRACR|nr:hypothetical protein DY000_02058451 [Brassica cretica]
MGERHRSQDELEGSSSDPAEMALKYRTTGDFSVDLIVIVSAFRRLCRFVGGLPPLFLFRISFYVSFVLALFGGTPPSSLRSGETADDGTIKGDVGSSGCSPFRRGLFSPTERRRRSARISRTCVTTALRTIWKRLGFGVGSSDPGVLRPRGSSEGDQA